MEADQQGTGKAELLAQNGNLATQLPQFTSNPLGAKDHVIRIKYTEKRYKSYSSTTTVGEDMYGWIERNNLL